MRKENDSMGTVEVPDDAYYGAQTQRALENFPISGIQMPQSIITAIAIIKRSAAIVNYNLNLLDKERKNASEKASNNLCRKNVEQ